MGEGREGGTGSAQAHFWSPNWYVGLQGRGLGGRGSGWKVQVAEQLGGEHLSFL